MFSVDWAAAVSCTVGIFSQDIKPFEYHEAIHTVKINAFVSMPMFSHTLQGDCSSATAFNANLYMVACSFGP